jgi:hypothetical protein
MGEIIIEQHKGTNNAMRDSDIEPLEAASLCINAAIGFIQEDGYSEEQALKMAVEAIQKRIIPRH